MQLSIRSNKIKKLGNLFNLYGGTTPSTSKKEYWNGDILWVTPTDITNLNNYSILSDTAKKITNKAVVDNSLKLLEPGTLLLTSRASIGWTILTEKQVTINQGITALIPKNENEIYPLFYYYYFRFIRNLLNSLASGSTFKEISKSTLKNLQISLPPLPTQKKIAEILSTADRAIQKVDEAIEKTQRLKKGVMHRLLTKGIGHTEFKDTEIGRIPKEWDMVAVENVFDLFGGSTPTTSKIEYWNGDISWVTPTDITAINKTMYLYKTEKHITQEAVNKFSLKIFDENNLLLTSRATIGWSAINKIPVSVNQGMTVFTPKNNNVVNNEYYFYYFQNIKDLLGQLGSGSTFKEVTKSTLKKLKISCPAYKEQTKIVDILKTIDEKLHNLHSKKQKLQCIKQGLMNELLTGEREVVL